jgi:mRNA interferase RelE/StbE
VKYKVEVVLSAERVLAKLQQRDKDKVIAKIDSLADNPRPEGYKKLKGSKKEPLYRIRAGDHRIVYTIHDGILMVVVVDLGHRRDIYR